ncbi:hypothetical protein V8E54_008337 [Elaphomyces granulatus]
MAPEYTCKAERIPREQKALGMNFAFGFKGEGPTHCMPLIFTARVGKQNQHGWLETIGAMRNEVCLADWHIYYLFYRWDYNRILADDLPGTTVGDAKVAFSYNSQRDLVEPLTDIGRSSGAAVHNQLDS